MNIKQTKKMMKRIAWHIIITLLKTDDKDKILKSARGGLCGWFNWLSI